MAVVEVGIVGMGVRERLVPVPMGVGLARWVVGGMSVSMVFVVHVPVLVLYRIVRMGMSVALDEVNPDPDPHQRAGDDEAGRHRFAE